MRTFFATIRSDHRLRLRCSHLLAVARRALVRIHDRLLGRLRPAAQDGFLLVEVIVSAMLVALIVIATFNGFDVVNRAQAEDRAHDQAVILAAESQEQLRTDPVSTLQALETTPHTYTQTVNGTSYEITQQAAPSNGSANTTGCSAVETTKQTGANVEITSRVTWAALGIAKRPEVKLSSIITPPTGSGLEVDVGNNPNPSEGVPGVTAVVTFTPVNSTTPESREGTTNNAGCVVFGDIEATAASVEIKEKSGFVTPSGTLKWPTKEVTLAPNITVHYPVTYDQGGAIQANFTWKGESVTGDSFVVANGSLTPAPNFEVGANLFSFESTGEEHYAAETGKYASSATTAKGARYSTGDLFPFLTNAWYVYPGDCSANEPHSVNATLVNREALVKPGATTEVNVPISRTNLLVREGTKSSSSTGPSGLQVKITNTACSSSLTPNNASTLNLTHEQKTTSEGKLENPFQPFGSYELCVANKTAKKRYKYLGSNTLEEGTSPTVYLGAKSSTEKSELKTKKEGEEHTTKTGRESEEATAKTKREGEEATAKSTRESAEATAKAKRVTEEKPAKEKWEKEEKTNKTTKESGEATKKSRETKESEEKTKWAKEETEKKITKKQKEEKEATQKTSREKLEKEEKTAKEKLEGEEKTTKTAREAQETTQKAKEKEESEAKTKKEKEEKEAKEKKETEEGTLKTKKLGEEETTKKAREKVETEETEEATATKVTVESGTSAEKC